MAQSQGGFDFDAVAERELRYIFERGHFPPQDQSPEEPVAPPAQTFARVWKETHPGQASEPGEPHAGEARVRKVTTDPSMPVLEGLALSGGGIRSACFCLGVLEGLARQGLLSKFHYVSSVSGGGYIAGWLAAWSYRHDSGMQGVQDVLKDAPSQSESPPELRHLSRYATYLAPKTGLLAPDVWSLLTAYLRNLAVTLAISLPVVLVLCTVPYIVALFLWTCCTQPVPLMLVGWATTATLVGCGLAMRILGDQRQLVELKTGLTDAFAWAVTLAGGLAYALTVRSGGLREWLKVAELDIRFPPLLALCIVVFLISAFALLVLQRASSRLRRWRSAKPKAEELGTLLRRILRSFWHCVVFAFSALLAVVALAVLEPLLRQAQPADDAATGIRQVFLLGTFAPLLWALALLLSQAFMHAVLSLALNDSDREWMARFVGLCLIAAVSWAALCGVGYWLPQASHVAGWTWLATAAALPLLLSRWLARERLPAVATLLATAFAFAAVGSIVFRSIGAHLSDRARADQKVDDLLIYCIVLVVWTVVFDWFVNVNRFSMHALYRDRLVRTFLGASRTVEPPQAGDGATARRGRPDDEQAQFRPRKAENFHRFDPDDNPKLKWLQSVPGDGAAHWMPVFLFNAALNRTWGALEPGRSAKAYAFMFSPFACGSPHTGYCETTEFGAPDGGVSLGTAIATSGAALSSRTGRFDNRLLSFFLTLVNLRLGWWLGNPNNPRTRSRQAPGFSLQAYLTELLGHTVKQRRWLHLSDGGHHENLGALELMRRGCRRIVLIDGSQDPQRQYDDLANLVRLAREELNVAIEPASDIKIGDRALGRNGRYAALFSVQFPQGQPGRLLYIKPCFYPGADNVPIDVQNYAMVHPSFPHEPTFDQFFSAAQFDAYRRLGRHQVQTLMADRTLADCELRDLFAQAQQHIGSR